MGFSYRYLQDERSESSEDERRVIRSFKVRIRDASELISADIACFQRKNSLKS